MSVILLVDGLPGNYAGTAGRGQVTPTDAPRHLHDQCDREHQRALGIIKSREHFPSDDAASKMIWLALRNITAEWGRAAHNWKEAMNQFAILYEDRFTKVAA